MASKKCPIWKKEKEIQKLKAEKRIVVPYHEAKTLVNMYSVPKPYLPSYATVVKSSAMKDMSKRVCESDIPSQTSLCVNKNKFYTIAEQEALGPHHSPESYWLNISHINTCKVTFLYCGPKCSETMT
jgi:hypothetical protein